MDYHYFAERAYTQSRLCGSRFWSELSQEERDTFAAFARAIEHDYQTPPDTWCPECDDLKDEIRDLEDTIDGLNERLDEIHRLTRK